LYIAVSLATPAPDPGQIAGLTWKNPLAVIFGESGSSSTPRLVAGLLLLTMAVLYYIFR
jgi:hypothetical protein